MTSGELAALITAIGVSLAGIITAIAALRGANYNALKVKDLETQLASVRAENERIKQQNQQQQQHMNIQDGFILDQQIKISKWHDWGQRMGRAFNVMQLEYGTLTQHREDRKQTGPLPALPERQVDTTPEGGDLR
jgi:hypothetical protein